MPRRPDNSLRERIIAAAPRVVALTGPAASGKTAAAIGIYDHVREHSGATACLLLVPNAPTAASMRRSLLDRSPTGVVLAPHVATFASLAGRILADAGPASAACRTLSPFRRRLLLREIVDQLRDAGTLHALGTVADTPGLIVTLDRAIAELKRAAVEPDALARAVGRGQRTCRDLLTIYESYQAHLHEAGLYDLEGRMWQARDCLRDAAPDGPPPGLDGVRAIVVDGFTDFTPTQLEILHLASRHVERVLITLPLADDGRDRLWQWTRRTLANIREQFTDDLDVIATDGAASADLAPLWKKLFDFDAAPGDLPDGTSVIATAGIDAEVAVVARRVKALLADGAAAGSIAVLARSLDAYGPAIERTFRAHGVGVAAAAQPLTSVPVVRFLLDVASLGPAFEFRGVLRTIKSSYFRPDLLGDFHEGTVAAAETLIRSGNVLEGRKAYALAAGRLARRARRDEEDDADAPRPERPSDFPAAADLLERLFDLAETARSPAGLSQLPGALGVPAAVADIGDDALVARDLRALAALTEALDDLPDPPPPMADVCEALSAVACPPQRHEALVDVLDVLDARALRYEHVFLLGLGEGQFPRRFTDQSLLSEADRLAWARRDIRLDCRRDLTAREMLLFYLSASRANASLTVSYLESDASGKGGAAGSFLLSLLAPFGGLDGAAEAGRLERILPGRFLPPPDELADPRDAVIAAVAGLFRDEGGDSSGALRWAVENRRDSLTRAAMGLWARHRRWSREPCDAFDGRISDADLLARLEDRFGEQAVFSASSFNAFGQCPWQFFASHVLRLAPLDEPQRRIEAVSRGLFCHAVLFRTMTRLRDEVGEAVDLAAVPAEQITAALVDAVAAEAERVEQTRPPYPVFWRIQCERMRKEMSDYLLTFRDKAAPGARSGHFELAFGRPRGDDDPVDPASSAEPVVLPTPAGPLRLRGKIDRVDWVETEDHAGLLVVDYKTGALPTQADMNAGRNLQAPLYAAAAEAMLHRDCLGGAFHGITRNTAAHFSALRPPRGDDRTFAQRRTDAMATAGWFATAMRSGLFDALPTHTCPSWCPYRRICHYADARADLKRPRSEEADA